MKKTKRSVSPKKKETEEAKMIKELIKEKEELEKVNYILKKAIEILSQKEK